MSNNTARLAREWAQFELDNAGEFSNKGRIAAAEHIMATTDPLTMADVEWDDEKHHLAGATAPFASGTKEVVMLTERDDDTIGFALMDGRFGSVRKTHVTPNGKKYELREVGAPEEPAHPATLVTEQDYENAPVGTVVAELGGWARTKGFCGDWSDGATWLTDREMANKQRQELRWGWGK